MRTALLAIILAIQSPHAFAKCGSVKFLVSGVVLQADRTPAAGALVGAAWEEDGLVAGPALARSDSDGRYSIPIVFRIYSSGPKDGAYACKGQLQELRISAYSGTRYAPPIVVHVSKSVTTVEAKTLELSFDISTDVPIEPGG
jgi:hypothetical protein